MRRFIFLIALIIMTHTTLFAGTGYETKEVSFRSWGVDLKGLLFVPEDFDESKSYPTVVFSGPLTQIKEQMGSDYGRAFARRGYIFLSFDHYGHGESAGEILTKANEARQRAYETGEAEYIDVISPYGGEIADYYMTARAGTERFSQYSHLSVAKAVEFTSLVE